MEEGGRAGSDEETPESGGHSPFFLPSGITDFDDDHSYDPLKKSSSSNNNNAFYNTSPTITSASKLYGYWPDNPSYEIKKGPSTHDNINSKLWAFNSSDNIPPVSEPEQAPARDATSPTKTQDGNDPTSTQEDPKNMVFRVERSGSESSYVYTFAPRIHIPASHPMASASTNHSDNVRFMSSSPWKIRHNQPPSDITPPSTPPLTHSSPSINKPTTPPTNPIRTERAGSLTGVTSAAQRAAQPRPLSSPPKMLTPIYNALTEPVSNDPNAFSLQQHQQHQYQQPSQYTPQPPQQGSNKPPATPPRSTLNAQAAPYHSPSYQQHPPQPPGRSSGQSSRNRAGSNSYPTPVPYVLVPQGHAVPIPPNPVYRPLYHPHRPNANNNMMQSNPPSGVQYWNGSWAYAAPQQSSASQSQYARDNRDKKFKSPKRGGAGRKTRVSTGSANYPGTITMAVVDKPVWKVKGRANTVSGTSPYISNSTSSTTVTTAASSTKPAQPRYEQATNRNGPKQSLPNAKKEGENQMEYKQIKLLRRDDPNSQAYLNGTVTQEAISQVAALKIDADAEEYEEEEADDEDEGYYDGDSFQSGHGGGDSDDDDPSGGSPSMGGGGSNASGYSQPPRNSDMNSSGRNNNNGQDRRTNYPSAYSKQQTVSSHSQHPKPPVLQSNTSNNQANDTIVTKLETDSEPCQAEKDAAQEIKKPRIPNVSRTTLKRDISSMRQRGPVFRVLSFFAIGIGLLCATVFTVLSLLLHIHRVAFTSGATMSTYFTILCVYAFPLLASLVSIVTWGPQFVWFVFLAWFCVVCGSSSNPTANTSLYIRLLVLVFLIEGAYEGDFMLSSSGGERIVLATVLIGLKAGRTIISTGHVVAFVLAMVFGSYHIVQWAILLAVLTAEGHYHKNGATNSAIHPNNYAIAKKQFALRKIRRVRV